MPKSETTSWVTTTTYSEARWKLAWIFQTSPATQKVLIKHIHCFENYIHINDSFASLEEKLE